MKNNNTVNTIVEYLMDTGKCLGNMAAVGGAAYLLYKTTKRAFKEHEEIDKKWEDRLLLNKK